MKALEAFKSNLELAGRREASMIGVCLAHDDLFARSTGGGAGTLPVVAAQPQHG